MLRTLFMLLTSRKKNIIYENYNHLADNVFHNTCVFFLFFVDFDLLSFFIQLFNERRMLMS